MDISSWVNMDYMFDLVRDYIAEADYHWSDHGDRVSIDTTLL